MTENRRLLLGDDQASPKNVGEPSNEEIQQCFLQLLGLTTAGIHSPPGLGYATARNNQVALIQCSKGICYTIVFSSLCSLLPRGIQYTRSPSPWPGPIGPHNVASAWGQHSVLHYSDHAKNAQYTPCSALFISFRSPRVTRVLYNVGALSGRRLAAHVSIESHPGGVCHL
ncbi:hypothetical protein AG1IA_03866 [Rhizoctonia solani AG-1 IA]|uniref:Uncharacterized protein n=1 Tax=Thanatephorus cucumeris (strain AG1-IA) TaxID=983506 RepID=L8WVF4_THACA|nr:hypothetical protein AG1IA_03866 [Rhizoctonia solani AG-1 IA]